jgi:hypothetical protein
MNHSWWVKMMARVPSPIARVIAACTESHFLLPHLGKRDVARKSKGESWDNGIKDFHLRNLISQ